MAKLSILFLAATLLSLVAGGSSDRGHPKVSCKDFKAPRVPGAKVVSIEATELRNHTVPSSPPFLPSPISDLDICAVDVVLTHADAHDQVLVRVWMPLEKWNGRFQANGGSGYLAGILDLSLGPSAKAGYASASTNAGVGPDPLTVENWALRPDGSVDVDALTNFAHRSVHDMAIVSKAIIKQFYGKEPRYSYWNGCSTGGRQGMAAAQRYPELFDGILAGAPAINWATYVIAEQWPQVVMSQEKTFPSQCELGAFTDAAIAECDALDGIVDGIINDPNACHFDPYQLVGKCIKCNGAKVTITEAVARVVLKVLQGPFDSTGEPLWYGLNAGAILDNLANTTVVGKTRIGYPLFVNDEWIRYFVAKDPEYNLSAIDYPTLEGLFAQSRTEYDAIIGTDAADLSRFEEAGGKLLMWHGLSDQLIFPKGTVDYRNRVERLMGGPAKVDDFFRLFLAPGVDHCAGTPSLGEVPEDLFGALVDWVEKDVTPNKLPALASGPRGGERILCPYPQVAQYVGGSTKSAHSFKCI